MRALAVLVGWYGATVILLGVAGLAVIPAYVTAGGADGWTSIALGQAAGVVGAMVVGFGWALTGPALVARASLRERYQVFVEVTVVRAGLLVVTGLGGGVVAGVLVDADGAALWFLAFLATAVTGSSNTWYLVGAGRARDLFVFEAVPRSLTVAVAAAGMLAGWPVVAGLVLVCAGAGGATVVSTVAILRGHRDHRGAREPLRAAALLRATRSQVSGFVSSTAGAVYLAVPVYLGSLLVPAEIGAFALVDKLNKQLATASQALVAAMQGWVPAGASAGQVRRRARLATAAAAGAGVVVFTAVIVLGDWVFGLLGASVVVVGPALLAGAGVLVSGALVERAITRSVGVPLVPPRRLSVVLTAGAVLGCACGAAGALAWGAAGLAGGVGVGSLVTGAVVLGWSRRPAGREQASRRHEMKEVRHGARIPPEPGA